MEPEQVGSTDSSEKYENTLAMVRSAERQLGDCIARVRALDQKLSMLIVGQSGVLLAGTNVRWSADYWWLGTVWLVTALVCLLVVAVAARSRSWPDAPDPADFWRKHAARDRLDFQSRLLATIVKTVDESNDLSKKKAGKFNLGLALLIISLIAVALAALICGGTNAGG